MAGVACRRAGVSLLGDAVVAGRAGLVLVKHWTIPWRRDTGAEEAVTRSVWRVQVFVGGFAIGMAEGVGLAGLRECDLGFQRAEKDLIVCGGAAVVIQLHDVNVADHLRDVGFDVGRFRRGCAAAAGHVAGNQIVERVVFDERADALGVQILVGDGDAAAAQEPSARHHEGGAHAAAQIEEPVRNRAGHCRSPGDAGMTGCGDVVQICAAGAARRGRGAGRLHVGSVTVVERGAGDPARVEHLDQPAHVIDVIVGEDGKVDRGDAERVEQSDDLRAAAGRATVDQQRLARRRDDQRRCSGADVDEIDSGLARLGVRTLHEQRQEHGSDGGKLLGHGARS